MQKNISFTNVFNSLTRRPMEVLGQYVPYQGSGKKDLAVELLKIGVF